MNPSLVEKLEQLSARAGEIHRLLAQPAVIGDQPKFRALSRELAGITPAVDAYAELRGRAASLAEARALLEDADGGIRKLAQEEVRRSALDVAESELALQKLLLPRDPNDERNIFLEIRAGTGGDEAAIFCGDMFRMYQAYAEGRRWPVEVLSARHGEHGGYKEIISRIVGRGAYSKLKFESGAHRVQRVPQTETQGRIHTSACTVAVLPEADAVTDAGINPRDLRVDTFRASGAGGQHVNRTDSAVRITHLPSGLVVECQDERSQHKNRARALAVLRARLVEAERKAQRDEEAATRRTLVGSGDRSERIRTYNFPQSRVTDHRIGLTLYKLDAVLAGDLEPLLSPLAAEHQAEAMAEAGG